jgi:hypothetical protein
MVGVLSWTDVGRIKSKTIEWVLVFSALITLSLNAGWLVRSHEHFCNVLLVELKRMIQNPNQKIKP